MKYLKTYENFRLNETGEADPDYKDEELEKEADKLLGTLKIGSEFSRTFITLNNEVNFDLYNYRSFEDLNIYNSILKKIQYKLIIYTSEKSGFGREILLVFNNEEERTEFKIKLEQELEKNHILIKI